MRGEVGAREGARVLLADHLLRGARAGGQFCEFVRQLGVGGEEGGAVGGAVPDVYLGSC